MTTSVPYTRLPRPTLWLMRGDEVEIGGDGADDQPRFRAETRAIYIARSPVTNEEYEAYDPAHPRSASAPGDRHPVVDVSFADASGYCRWYSEASGKAFRLPTEIEWEFACRAGAPGRYFWGDDADAGDRFVWDSRTSGGSCREIETSVPNAHGLYDLLGQVWEWTGSLYRPYPLDPDDEADDPDADGDRVIRGGSFRTERSCLGCAVRNHIARDVRRDDLGFRIARFL